MCGIFGYTGARPALDLVMGGLQQLEYRGYDSTGVCLSSHDGHQRVRAAANLAALRSELETTDVVSATTGIGHTRWATHGEVCVDNTHPFLGCASGHYAVALNGIIENFVELRDELTARGHVFESSTDAEVVTHLLEEQADLEPNDALSAVAAQLHGHFAIVAMDSRRPHLLMGTRREVPLVVGLGQNEHFMSSSVEAMLAHTKRFILLDDDDVVILDGENPEVRRPDGSVVVCEEVIVDRPFAASNHDGFASFMAKEIAQQPQVIADTIAGRISGSSVTLDAGVGIDPTQIGRVVIVGCGTALHAGLTARPMFEQWANLHTEVAVASEWRHSKPTVDDRTLVIAISQSGETADTLAAVRLAQTLGATTIGVTNMPDSQLTREVDFVHYTRAGVEMSVAATKTYTAQLTLLTLLALDLATKRSTMSLETREAVLMEIEFVPAKMRSMLMPSATIRRVAERLAESPYVVFLGRQSAVAVAMEGALKLREIAYIPAEVYPAGELKHGPIALIESGTPVVAVMTRGTEPSRTLSNLHEVRSRGAYVIALATEGDTDVASVADEIVWVPRTDPSLEALLSVIALQRLAHDVSVELGLNVDQPRNLAKTVTVE